MFCLGELSGRASVSSEPLALRHSSSTTVYSTHFTFHVHQCRNVTMAERREFDLFAYIFNREGETAEPPTERQEEDAHLVDLTVDSDEDGAGNSTAVVIQQDQPQSSSEQPRGRLQESVTESEGEDEDGDSLSRRSAVSTGARSGGWERNVYSLEIITFSQLEQENEEGAQRVLDLHRDDTRTGSVHVCSRFISGKCDYMSKDSGHILAHIKCRHPNEKHPGYKITQYPGFEDRKISEFVTKPYAELKQTDPQLAKEVLALYNRPQNKKKQEVHLCGHFVRGKCHYSSISTAHVKSHMSTKHSKALPIIRIIGYPEEGETYPEYGQMTYPTTTATAISPSRTSINLPFHVDQCSKDTTAKKREFDIFNYIFNREGEADEPPTEPTEEQLPLMNLTVNSDEDDVSNPTLAVIQPQQPQSSRLPRRAQPSKLQEPTTDSEEEDEDSSDEEASSSSGTRPVKTEASSRERKSNVHSLESIKFNQLEEKDKDGAKLVLDLYRDERQRCSVHVCSRFMSGKCRFMTKSSRNLSTHMKCRHPNAKHPGYKIIQYPGFKDLKAYDFVTKPYSQLKQTDPRLAEEVLALYKRPQNKKRRKVHLCGHFDRGKCEYFSTHTGTVKTHMARKHSRTLPMIKVVGYPGERKRTFYKYEQMTYAELKRKRSNVADEVLKYYYGHNCPGKVHLCGSCDYFSYCGKVVRDHIASHHPPTTRVYKIIEYPRLERD